MHNVFNWKLLFSSSKQKRNCPTFTDFLLGFVITAERVISISVLTGLYCFFCMDFLDQRKKSAVAKRVMAAPMV